MWFCTTVFVSLKEQKREKKWKLRKHFDGIQKVAIKIRTHKGEKRNILMRRQSAGNWGWFSPRWNGINHLRWSLCSHVYQTQRKRFQQNTLVYCLASKGDVNCLISQTLSDARPPRRHVSLWWWQVKSPDVWALPKFARQRSLSRFSLPKKNFMFCVEVWSLREKKTHSLKTRSGAK